MKLNLIRLALFVAAPIVLFAVLFRPHAASAGGGARQQRTGLGAAPATGWLEGTITATDGKVLRNHFNVNNNFGAYIRGTRQGGGTFEAYSDPRMGGLSSVRNLKPGVYAVFVPIAYDERLTKFRTQHLFGVVVRPGARTVLNITTESGETLDDRISSSATTAPEASPPPESGPVWALPSPNAFWSCTAALSRCEAPPARARPSSSPCRFTSPDFLLAPRPSWPT